MDTFNCSETDLDYSFTTCEWSDCECSSNGTCICLVDSSSSLTVEKCSFTNSTALQGCGGAIYVSKINRVNINTSFFLRCNILSASYHEHGGGCVYLHFVSVRVLIHSSSFAYSSVPFDGAGVDLISCSSLVSNDRTFYECRFIGCHGKAETVLSSEYNDAEGGGLIAWNNSYCVGVSNTLFCNCSNRQGGALFLEFSCYPPEKYPVQFCFFTQNCISNNGIGCDVALHDFSPENAKKVFLFSFTTSEEDSVCYYYNHDWINLELTWLPLGCT